MPYATTAQTKYSTGVLGVFVGVAVFVAVAVAVAVGEGGSRFGAPGEGGPSYHVSSGARLRLTSGELPA